MKLDLFVAVEGWRPTKATSCLVTFVVIATATITVEYTIYALTLHAGAWELVQANKNSKPVTTALLSTSCCQVDNSTVQNMALQLVQFLYTSCQVDTVKTFSTRSQADIVLLTCSQVHIVPCFCQVDPVFLLTLPPRACCMVSHCTIFFTFIDLRGRPRSRGGLDRSSAKKSVGPRRTDFRVNLTGLPDGTSWQDVKR